MEKLKETMKQWVEEGICIAFSGGVDSSLILKIACDLGREQGKKVVAVTFDTTLHPMGDLEIAKKVAEEFGAEHHVISVDEREQEGILWNPENRCYICKKYLFETLKEYGKNLGLLHMVEGTNYNDLFVYRPGIQALKELNIHSPLAELEIGKATVRKWAEELEISVSHRPSAPCLATRLPYNTRISWELIENIAQGEAYLKTLAFETCRIRVHGDIARIEILEEEFGLFIEKKSDIIQTLKKLGFVYITLDLEGFRSGSMDIHRQKGENTWM